MSPSIEAWLPQLLTQACHCVTAKPLYSFMSPSLQCENSLFLDLSIKLQWDTYLQVAIKHVVSVRWTCPSEDTSMLSRAQFSAVSGLTTLTATSIAVLQS